MDSLPIVTKLNVVSLTDVASFSIAACSSSGKIDVVVIRRNLTNHGATIGASAVPQQSSMRASSGNIRLSASDLSNHLACHHLTSLDLAVSLGRDPSRGGIPRMRRCFKERGMAHENAYLSHLQAQGCPLSIFGILITPKRH